ncbi:GNAT family N-acetyltransferase [Natronoglycomyces albus]|uniref:GNAT family N-acetyltransferase n=1 Tax=Natronoglycomyces albus TaxID=2811108 RepID=UPI003CCD087C
MVELRAEAEQWMARAGIDQWVPLHHAQSRQLMKNSVASGKAWVVVCESTNDVAGTATIDGPDLDWWTETDDLNNAVYVYKMITSRHHSGHDLGGAILDWVGRKARAENKAYIRLDCRRDNWGLHAYYERHQFDCVRIMDTPLRPTNMPRFTGALFQRPAEIQTSHTVVTENMTLSTISGQQQLKMHITKALSHRTPISCSELRFHQM